MTRAPLRFLLTILALWIGVRAAILLPGWPGESSSTPATTAAPRPALSERRSAIAAATETPLEGPGASFGVQRPAYPLPREISLPLLLAPAPARQPVVNPSTPSPPAGPKAASPSMSPSAPLPVSRPRPASSRWSASAWLLTRDNDGGVALAPGGMLGGSQAGARVAYALGGGLSLSSRVYLPLRHRSGAELAAGIDWRPVSSIPVSLLAERRQRLGRTGRNAFAVTLYGGASRNLTPRVRLDLYGQAGMVGIRSRDLFADGSLRLARRVGPLEVGAGAWGAAQPGATRLDAGPSLSWRLPVPSTNLRLQADWRFRIAGDAAPPSGPALTLAADF